MLNFKLSAAWLIWVTVEIYFANNSFRLLPLLPNAKEYIALNIVCAIWHCSPLCKRCCIVLLWTRSGKSNGFARVTTIISIALCYTGEQHGGKKSPYCVLQGHTFGHHFVWRYPTILKHQDINRSKCTNGFKMGNSTLINIEAPRGLT